MFQQDLFLNLPVDLSVPLPPKETIDVVFSEEIARVNYNNLQHGFL